MGDAQFSRAGELGEQYAWLLKGMRMPKVVDHDQRRIEIVEATWRIISRVGFEQATLQNISAEAGYANGAIKPYFPTKDDLLTFAFEFVFTQTNARMAEATRGLYGMDALRTYCLEILPTSDLKLNEARIVIPFWQLSLSDQAKFDIHEKAMQRWRRTMARYLEEAKDAGEIPADRSTELVVGQLLNMTLGAQITATLTPQEQSVSGLIDQLDVFLGMVGTPSTRFKPKTKAAALNGA
jgi:AcrR family transcriptional regulator